MAKKRITFRFEDKAATSVAVAGTFNAWLPDAFFLKKDKGGVWSGVKMLAPGRYEYRFVINGDRWMADPGAAEQTNNEFGAQNSVLIVPGVIPQ